MSKFFPIGMLSVMVLLIGCGSRPMPVQHGASPRAATLAPEGVDRMAGHADHDLEESDEVRVRTRSGILYLPPGLQTENGTIDLVIHFHGAPDTLIPAFQRSGVQAALFIVNLGIGSGPYEKRFSDKASFPRLLTAVEKTVRNTLDNHDASLRRVALSGWSAGYGAVLRILARAADAKRVDAVLLADGMHTKLRDKRRREVHPLGMATYTRFAEMAVAGEKLMSVAYSFIKPQNYASTSETAQFLAKAAGATVHNDDSTLAGGMHRTERADRGGLHLHGFEGKDASAHVDHLVHIDDTLLEGLRAHWSKVARPAQSGAELATTSPVG